MSRPFETAKSKSPSARSVGLPLARPITSTAENYLRQILLLADGDRASVSVGATARVLSVVPGTATTMMKSLAKAGLINHRLRHRVSLTPAGRRAAMNVLRKNRLAALFLVSRLKLNAAAADLEADRLEHAFSDKVAARLDTLLGHPTRDSYGNQIPKL